MDKPCAFCGSQTLHVEDHIGTIVISCADCLSVGPVTAAQRQEQAWERWNTRHRPEQEGGCCSHLPYLPIDFELDDYL